MIEGFAKIQEISIRKYMPSLRKEIDQNDSSPLSEEITVRTKLVLRRKLEVNQNGYVKSTNIIDVKLILSDYNAQTSFYISTTPDLNYEEGRESLNELNTFYFDAELIIYLPKSDLQLFLNNLNSDMYINTSFYLKDSLNSQGEVIAEKSINFYEVSSFECSYLIGRKHVHWYAEGLRQKVESHLDNLLIKRRGQVSQIVNELSESAANQGYILDEYDKDLENIIDLVSDMRSALRSHEPDPSADYDYANIWCLNATDFQSAIKEFPDSKQKELIEKYDQLWKIVDLSRALKWGEDKYGAIAVGFDPKQDEIENVAYKYLKLKTLRSKELEKILINSLIYTETIAFARTILSKKKIWGMSIPSIIDSKEVEDGQSYFQIIVKTFWEVGKIMFFEAIKLVTTFLIALFVTGENVIAAWIVTTGYTVFRWWRGVFTASLSSENKKYVLLEKMIQVHKLANNYNYDAGHLKDQLLEVSREGAVFSPYVFALLDFQIDKKRNS